MQHFLLCLLVLLSLPLTVMPLWYIAGHPVAAAAHDAAAGVPAPGQPAKRFAKADADSSWTSTPFPSERLSSWDPNQRKSARQLGHAAHYWQCSSTLSPASQTPGTPLHLLHSLDVASGQQTVVAAA